MGCIRARLHLLLDDCMDAGGRATHGAVAERVDDMDSSHTMVL